MNTLHVYDPAMCCSTGVCGPQVDPSLVRFAADLKWLASKDVDVQRFNLAQNPAAFVESEIVRATMSAKGDSALPIVIANGKVLAAGRYPGREEMGSWFNLADMASATLKLNSGSGDCCCGGKC